MRPARCPGTMPGWPARSRRRQGAVHRQAHDRREGPRADAAPAQPPASRRGWGGARSTMGRCRCISTRATRGLPIDSLKGVVARAAHGPPGAAAVPGAAQRKELCHAGSRLASPVSPGAAAAPAARRQRRGRRSPTRARCRAGRDVGWPAHCWSTPAPGAKPAAQVALDGAAWCVEHFARFWVHPCCELMQAEATPGPSIGDDKNEVEY